MKKAINLLIIVLIFNLSFINAFGNNSIPKSDSGKMALVIIDVQNFYFSEGNLPLVNPEEASLKAKELLEKFRKEKLPVIHIRHNSSSQAEIHINVAPIDGEKVISKDFANGFKETDLLNYLNENKITKLILCGMQTHMCVEATTRAASDFGFDCIVVEDACATRDLKYKDKIIKAEDVHFSTLSSLKGSYAKIIDTKTFIIQFK